MGRSSLKAMLFSDIGVGNWVGKKGEENYWAAGICDIVIGYEYYLQHRGLFVIGNEIAYADLVPFQLYHDENLTQDS